MQAITSSRPLVDAIDTRPCRWSGAGLDVHFGQRSEAAKILVQAGGGLRGSLSRRLQKQQPSNAAPAADASTRLSPRGPAKLTLTHSIERPDSKFIGAVSDGWPMVMSNLKSLLETGMLLSSIIAGTEIKHGKSGLEIHGSRP